MESPWSRPLTSLQSAWGQSPPEGGWGNASAPEAQQHGSAERPDPNPSRDGFHSGATPSDFSSSPSPFTINLRSVGIDSLIKLDLSTRDSAIESLDGASRQLRRLGLLRVVQHGIHPSHPTCTVEADEAARDILYEMYKHDVKISKAIRMLPGTPSSAAVFEFLSEYTLEDEDTDHYTSEESVYKFSFGFVAANGVKDDFIRSKFIDFFDLVSRLHPSRRGSNLFWCRHIVNKLPHVFRSQKSLLKSKLDSESRHSRSSADFAKLIIKALKDIRLEQGGAKDAPVVDDEDLTHASFQVAARQPSGKAKCQSCSFFDCPKATDATAACDVHSTSLSNIRALKLMKENPKYLALVLHSREEAAAKASAPAPSPAPAPAPSVTATQKRTTSYSDVVAGRRDFVAECLTSMEDDPVV